MSEAAQATGEGNGEAVDPSSVFGIKPGSLFEHMRALTVQAQDIALLTGAHELMVKLSIEEGVRKALKNAGVSIETIRQVFIEMEAARTTVERYDAVLYDQYLTSALHSLSQHTIEKSEGKDAVLDTDALMEKAAQIAQAHLDCFKATEHYRCSLQSRIEEYRASLR